MSYSPAVLQRRALEGEARRAHRIAEVVRRLTRAADAARRYLQGGPYPRWAPTSPRRELEDQVTAIEFHLAALANEVQVLMLVRPPPAREPDPSIVAKIA